MGGKFFSGSGGNAKQINFYFKPHYWTKWPVGIWASPLLHRMSCKLDARSSNSYSFTGLNVHSSSIYHGEHWYWSFEYWHICPLTYLWRPILLCLNLFIKLLKLDNKKNPEKKETNIIIYKKSVLSSIFCLVLYY